MVFVGRRSDYDIKSLVMQIFFSDLKDTDIPVSFSIASTDRAGLTWAEERAAEGVDVVRQERGGSAKLKKCQHLQKKHSWCGELEDGGSCDHIDRSTRQESGDCVNGEHCERRD